MRKNSNFTKNILNCKKYVVSIFSSFLILAFAWSGVFTDINSTASAQGLDIQSKPQIIAFGSDDASDIDQKAKNSFDSVVGAGSSDKIEGSVEQAYGSAQRNLGKVTGQAEGVTKQIEGKTKQSIGETKDAAQDAASNIEDKTDSIIDSIRNFFNN